MSDRPAPAIDPELFFEQSVPHYPLVINALVPSSPNWFVELGALDGSDPWSVWRLSRPAEHIYNTFSRPQHPEFPVFVPASVA